MYTEFYHLREEPFRLTPDPRVLHLAEPHRTALSVLLEGILGRKGFLVLCGPIGTGKTTLMHAALHLLEENSTLKGKLKTAFLVNPTLSREEFLEAVLDEFEVPCSATSKPRRLAALHEMLLATQRGGGTAVLIVDEAHLLTAELLEEIRLLSNTDSYQEKLLQVVLSGQSEVHAHLHHPSMRALLQRIASTCQLRPLSVPETRVYVMERLHAGGLQGESPFPASVFQHIYKYAAGVPRLINLLCDSALAIACDHQKRYVDAAVVEEAAAKLSLLPEQIQAAESVASSLFGRNGNSAQVAKAEQEIRTAVDLLIGAMKQNRAFARE
jgi:general secretion pathway protein A